MRKQLITAFFMVLAMTVLCGLLYPLVVLGASQVAFKDKANGSIVTASGTAVGSSLLGQGFTDAKYFHPRPSAAGTNGYDAAASGASNLGPTNDTLIGELVPQRAAAYRAENGLDAKALVPVDAVTASGSGLDPAISVANARLQAPRVAASRGMALDSLLAAVDAHTAAAPLGVLGASTVNVFELNLALDGGR